MFVPETQGVETCGHEFGSANHNGTQVQKLRTAMQEYETDRWRIIASKVGQGFSATACREKASELKAIEQAGGEEEEEEEESGYTQTQLAPGPSDQAATYQ